MSVSFLTPYLNGEDMMRLHIQSIRQFYPDSPILISTPSTNLAECEYLEGEYGVRVFYENLCYVDAFKNLLSRCPTDVGIICDHDTVILNNFDHLIDKLDQEYDVVGIEENIKVPWGDDKMRNIPGFMDATFLMFNIKKFLDTYGIEGIKYQEVPGFRNSEYHYGILQKLKRHKYLLPFHVKKYGMGNLIKDGDTDILWHQWYGSYRVRNIIPELDEVASHGGVEYLRNAEQQFLSDYPNLDFSEQVCAWQ